ncbi:quinon protein alcohol dehydrogenase-like superfamily [Podospora didyma]|uniref:Quinon protein alcohol dehydrogenase-like superfamily n=1 Tax=Podospora didyma TaxID=330526 RepID=A0AAE0NXP3_9PEZI|nr:quinon protein alcohol dehydrogenase-like superfamily [Podospora didyma]
MTHAGDQLFAMNLVSGMRVYDTSTRQFRSLMTFDTTTGQPVHHYICPTASETYVIKCSFGGVEDMFASNGSEGGSIYIWDRSSERLVASLLGHPPGCNNVKWNPIKQTMMASGGDDGKVILWQIETKRDSA